VHFVDDGKEGVVAVAIVAHGVDLRRKSLDLSGLYDGGFSTVGALRC